MVEPGHRRLSISRQCELVGIARSSFYYECKGESSLNLELMRQIDEQFMETPWYGARQMARHFRRRAYCVGRKRIRRLMRQIGVSAIYQTPRTSKPNPEHRIYPYLLRGVTIDASASRLRSALKGLPARFAPYVPEGNVDIKGRIEGRVRWPDADIHVRADGIVGDGFRSAELSVSKSRDTVNVSSAIAAQAGGGLTVTLGGTVDERLQSVDLTVSRFELTRGGESWKLSSESRIRFNPSAPFASQVASPSPGRTTPSATGRRGCSAFPSKGATCWRVGFNSRPASKSQASPSTRRMARR